jgi:hypothetical protein
VVQSYKRAKKISLRSLEKSNIERPVMAIQLAQTRVREISIYVDFVPFYVTAHNRELRKVPREFFKL